MAFSTQKEFFYVPFMNEIVKTKCGKECVKLKTYPSTYDVRSWAADENKNSKFVSDMVACNTPDIYLRHQDPNERNGPGKGQGRGPYDDPRGHQGGPSRGRGPGQGPDSHSPSGRGPPHQGQGQAGYGQAADPRGYREDGQRPGGATGQDIGNYDQGGRGRSPGYDQQPGSRRSGSSPANYGQDDRKETRDRGPGQGHPDRNGRGPGQSAGPGGYGAGSGSDQGRTGGPAQGYGRDGQDSDGRGFQGPGSYDQGRYGPEGDKNADDRRVRPSSSEYEQNNQGPSGRRGDSPAQGQGGGPTHGYGKDGQGTGGRSGGRSGTPERIQGPGGYGQYPDASAYIQDEHGTGSREGRAQGPNSAGYGPSYSGPGQGGPVQDYDQSGRGPGQSPGADGYMQDSYGRDGEGQAQSGYGQSAGGPSEGGPAQGYGQNGRGPGQSPGPGGYGRDGQGQAESGYGPRQGVPAHSYTQDGRGPEQGPGQGGYGRDDPGQGKDNLGPGRRSKSDIDGRLLPSDHLLNSAGDTMDGMKEIMIKNNLLPKDAADSNDRKKPTTTAMPSPEIQRIMKQRYDPESSKELQSKIQQLSSQHKIDANDERQLNALKHKIDDLNKAYEIRDAENAYLRRIIEKQAARAPMESIQIDPERSKDVNYLQHKIDTLGKELAVLRQQENNLMAKAGSGAFESGNLDAERIQQILAEREGLRQKINALSNLGDKLMKPKSAAADDDLNKTLCQQKQNVADMENDLLHMQIYYENKLKSAKCRCEDLEKKVQVTAQSSKCLQKEINVLRNELHKRDLAISYNDCQYEQLMAVICELNQKYGNQRGDCPGFDVVECPDVGKDLVFYTAVTLEHIIKELNKQADCFKQINQDQYQGGQSINNLQDCMEELERLKYLLREKDHQVGVLVEDNACMCQSALESDKRINELDQRVKELDKETRNMEEGMRESISLIQDIGTVARQNERLKDTVNQMKSSELQELIDNLERQLKDCRNRVELAEEQNKALREALSKLGGDPDAIQREVAAKVAEKQQAEAQKEADAKQELAAKEKAAKEKALRELPDKPVGAQETDKPVGDKPIDSVTRRPDDRLAGFERDEAIKKSEKVATEKSAPGTEPYADKARSEAPAKDVTEKAKQGEVDKAKSGVDDKTVAKAADKAGAEATDKSKAKSDDKPDLSAESPDRTGAKSLDSVQKSPVESAAKVIDKDSAKSADKPEPDAADKTSPKAAEKAETKTPGKSAPGAEEAIKGDGKSAEKRGTETAAKPGAKLADQPDVAKVGDRPATKADEKPTAQTTDKIGSNAAGKAAERAGTASTEKPGATAAEKSGAAAVGEKQGTASAEKTGAAAAVIPGAAAKPGAVAAEKPGAAAAEKPGAAAGERSGAADTTKPGAAAAEKPGGAAAEKPGAATAKKPGAAAAEKPGVAAAAKPGAAAAAKSGAAASEKPGTSAAEKPGASAAERAGAAAVEKLGEATTDKPGVASVPAKLGAAPADKTGAAAADKPRAAGPAAAKAVPASAAAAAADKAGKIGTEKPRASAAKGAAGATGESDAAEEKRLEQAAPSKQKDGGRVAPGEKPSKPLGQVGDKSRGSGPEKPTTIGGKSGSPSKVAVGPKVGKSDDQRIDGMPGKAAAGGGSGERRGLAAKPGLQGPAKDRHDADGGGRAGEGRRPQKASKLDITTEEQFNKFVKETVKTLSTGDIDGVGLERELRKILDMFIDECGFCFCKCNVPKSRFYAICHRLYHNGLHTLDFKELAYMHRRIFAAAENILPGRLFNSIMKDFMSNSNVQAMSTVNQANPTPSSELRCCDCKSSLCCGESDENLMLKVMRLENDIENAKQCLKSIRNVPSNLSVAEFRFDGGDNVNEKTVRQACESNSVRMYKQIKHARNLKKTSAAKV